MKPTIEEIAEFITEDPSEHILLEGKLEDIEQFLRKEMPKRPTAAVADEFDLTKEAAKFAVTKILDRIKAARAEDEPEPEAEEPEAEAEPEEIDKETEEDVYARRQKYGKFIRNIQQNLVYPDDFKKTDLSKWGLEDTNDPQTLPGIHSGEANPPKIVLGDRISASSESVKKRSLRMLLSIWAAAGYRVDTGDRDYDEHFRRIRKRGKLPDEFFEVGQKTSA